MEKRRIENEYAEFYIEDGIVYFNYKSEQHIDLEAAKKVVSDRLKLQRDESYVILCNITGLKEVTKEARDFLAKEGSRQVKAVALTGAAPAARVMTNFYLMVNKPLVPTKIFGNVSDAIKFLENYKD